ncbi:ABC transporter ATP-binding protein [soil metagenome]
MSARLQVQGLSRRFGGLIALSEMSFDTERGQIFGVIGPNGAGKTTLFNVISGAIAPSGGEVLFDGARISGLPIERISRLGVARTFQSTNIFKSETVEENLRRGALLSSIYSPTAYLRSLLFSRTTSRSAAPSIPEVAKFIGLSGVLDKPAAGLAYGLQKILGVGMAMMTGPQLMLMDEPAAGLNPTEKVMMGRLIRELTDTRGIDVVVVEHDMPLIMQTCDRIMVMSYGKKIALGTPEAIRSDKNVIDAYLGAEYEFS